MSADSEDSKAGDAESGENSPRAGERLAAARRDKQISIDEISKELHLDEPKVRALERNEFDMLGAPVFAKGHLRKYAQLVDVPIDDILVEYYEITRSDGMPPVVGAVRPRDREINLGRWLLVLFLLLVAAAAYWWFFAREVTSADTVRNPSAEIRLPNQDGTDTEDDRVAAESPPPVAEALPERDVLIEPGKTPTEAVAEPPAAIPQPTTSRPARNPVPTAGEVGVELSFSGDCWTEITDADGERLFFGLGADGRRVSVAGVPPLSVLFGDADNVSLSVNGKNYPITAANRRGKTARFSIQAP
jgi:cytoskeleton protein RodZ